MKLLRGVLAVAASVLALGAAHAQVRIPTDIELKAAYCVKVVQGQIALYQSLPQISQEGEKIKADSIRAAEDRLNRLKLYVMPRMSVLDPTAMLAAMKRGETDFATKTDDAVDETCDKTCQFKAKPGGESARCFSDCLALHDPRVARLQSCANINWLPF